MSDWLRRLLGLGLPCLLAFLLDLSYTLHGQPPEYWAGNYGQTTEGAPFYRMLYQWSPVGAVFGHLIWAGLIGGLLILLPEVFAIVLAIAVVFGHTAGAYTWINAMLMRANGVEASGWYQVANGMFLLSALVVGVGVHWEVRSSALSGEPVASRRLSGRIRWCLVAMIFSAVAAIVFAPW